MRVKSQQNARDPSGRCGTAGGCTFFRRPRNHSNSMTSDTRKEHHMNRPQDLSRAGRVLLIRHMTFGVREVCCWRIPSKAKSLALLSFDRSDQPLLIVEIKEDNCAQKGGLPYHADNQMRGGYALMLEERLVPRLWGISLPSTSMRDDCASTTGTPNCAWQLIHRFHASTLARQCSHCAAAPIGEMIS